MAANPIGTHEEVSWAVDGKGIYFYFDRKKKTAVLNDVNISVRRGAIYSLLGPSGCGKSTLLKCIVGQHKLQVGSLRIYGKAPRSKGFFIPGRGVGYMPQEMALYTEMNTQETLAYFGSLYFMSQSEINERTSFLVDLLALPDKKKLIKYLSGGQRRRVSLAATLIHRPPLVILDEPTVGVDPLLRQAIWDYLAILAKDERLTIIITTHYIEEARQAHVVGLMRDGHLLAERNPEDLIEQYQVVTLENVFLRLCKSNCNEEDEDYKIRSVAVDAVESFCRNSSTVWLSKDENKEHADKELLGKSEQIHILSPVKEVCSFSRSRTIGTFDKRNELQDNATALLSPSSHKDDDLITTNQTFTDSWKRMLCLTKNNFLRFKRNKLLMIVQVLLPFIEMSIFFMCIGGPPFDLPVAVTNEEENPGGLGKEFLHFINSGTILQKEFSNFSDALNSVKSGESWAALYIGPEFTNCLTERYTLGAEVDNDTVACSEIKLYLDMSNQQNAMTIYTDLLKSFHTFAANMLLKYDKNPVLANPPIVLQDPVYGSATAAYTEFVAPGMIISLTYITCVGLTALAVILEKKQGLLERTFAAGASPGEVLMSLFIVMLAAMTAHIITILLCAFLLFSIPCNGPFVWVSIGVLLAGIGGMTYGICISSVCDDESTAMFVAIGSFFPNLLLSGVMWPIEAMPHYLRYFSYSLPLTLMSNSLRSIMSRGWNIIDYYTFDGYLICIAWAIIFMGISMLLFKFKK